MAWTAPRTWVAGEVVTAALMNTHVRDDLRYIKGLDGVVTIESGLICDSAGGDEYVRLSSLTTAERDAIGSPANGMIIYNETTNEFNKYENGSWKDFGAGTDHGGLDGRSDDDHTQYTLINGSRAFTGTGAGFKDEDNMASNSATATVSQQSLVAYVAANSASPTIDVYPHAGASTLNSNDGDYACAVSNDMADVHTYFAFSVPDNYTSTTKCIVKVATQGGAGGNLWRAVNTDFAANGEAKTTHSDSIAAATVALTTNVITEDDITAALTGMAAGDTVGLDYNRIGNHGNDTLGAALSIYKLTFEYV